MLQAAATAEDAAFMADLLGTVDTSVSNRRLAPRIKPVKTETRRKTRLLSPPIEKPARDSSSNQSHNDPPSEAAESRPDDEDAPLLYGDDIEMDDVAPLSSPVAKAVERKASAVVKVEEEEEDSMEITQVVNHARIHTASVNMSGSRPVPKIKKVDYPTPESSSPERPNTTDIDASSWNHVTSNLNVVKSPMDTSSVGKLSARDALEDDGTLRMFWLDYAEVNGSLCLFGKVKDRSSGAFKSCFVKIDNILRKLYFLPRVYRQKHGRDTSEEVEMSDVYEEVDGLMSKLRVGMHKIKPCSRKYAFELPDIPKEADYLKLLYPYNKPALATDLTGSTFSHVFGTNTSLFEQFVLWKNIMGPCWLKIDAEGANFNAVNNASWCKLELQVDRPNLISVLGDVDNLEAPTLTLMSIALRTTYKAKENRQEILVASARVYEDVSLTDTTSADKLPCKTFTIMRPHSDAYPLGFNMEAEKHKGVIKMEKTEGALLSVFMAIFQKMDPDVLMGHRLDDVDYSILLSRMRERKTPGWHRIGRLRRSDWPKNVGKGGGSFFAERQLASGRLLCDLANDLGKVRVTKVLWRQTLTILLVPHDQVSVLELE